MLEKMMNIMTSVKEDVATLRTENNQVKKTISDATAHAAEEVKVALKRKMGDEIMSDFARKWLIVKRRKSTYHETASAP